MRLFSFKLNMAFLTTNVAIKNATDVSALFGWLQNNARHCPPYNYKKISGMTPEIFFVSKKVCLIRMITLHRKLHKKKDDRRPSFFYLDCKRYYSAAGASVASAAGASAAGASAAGADDLRLRRVRVFLAEALSLSMFSL